MSSSDEIHEAVKSRYASIAKAASASCCTGGCGQTGYNPEELAALPQEAVLGLGCGNPVGLAAIGEGDTVLDLGSGGGIDVFLAAQRVGQAGKVIGIDMTTEMLELARSNALRLGFDNVDFRHGKIEALPLANESVDVILSNCVINLAPDKSTVFDEAFRVLKPGGRLVVSDMVSSGPLPEELRSDLKRWASCLGGALPEKEYLAIILAAGFARVDVINRDQMDMDHVYSITVRADKATNGV